MKYLTEISDPKECRRMITICAICKGIQKELMTCGKDEYQIMFGSGWFKET